MASRNAHFMRVFIMGADDISAPKIGRSGPGNGHNRVFLRGFSRPIFLLGLRSARAGAQPLP
jgi:hypothetical protein